MAQIISSEQILNLVNAMAEANGTTYDLTKGSLEDLVKQTVAAAKVFQDFLELKD